MHRPLTRSSNVNIWLEECRKFCDHLRARGYPARAIDAIFCKNSWNQWSKLLEPKVTSKADNFFTLYNRNLWTWGPLALKGAGRCWSYRLCCQQSRLDCTSECCSGAAGAVANALISHSWEENLAGLESQRESCQHDMGCRTKIFGERRRDSSPKPQWRSFDPDAKPIHWAEFHDEETSELPNAYEAKLPEPCRLDCELLF